MTGKRTFQLPAVHFNSLLFICALLPALLFKGPQIEFFAITQIVLIIWAGRILLQSRETGLHIPRTSLAACLTLFWFWLALSLSWSLAPGISVINFWWVGSLALVFWLYALSSDRDVIWLHTAVIFLVIALVLALMGIYQVYVLEQHARSVFETRNTHAAFLNLVALPASAYFLRITADKTTEPHRSGLLGGVLFFLFLSIFLTASRGASVSLALSIALLMALTIPSVPRRSIFLLLALVTAAFLATKISHGELGERLPQLMQDSPRRLIWESSWHLLQTSPWHGLGLGLFYLAYPPYRNPADGSGGFFAHNDYLQIWIETGFPGLLLLLALLGSAFWLFIRYLRKTGVRHQTHIEATGIFCGLLAVATHSVVDFNLYILSIMMVSGLALARFQSLVTRELEIRSILFRPSRFVGRRAFSLIVILLALLPACYFVALGMANSYYDKGLALAREGKLPEADKSLATAHRLTPHDDRMLIAHADLYRHALSLLPSAADEGKALYENALGFLDQAEKANSLRGLTWVIRGRIYQQNVARAGENAQKLAAECFRRALTLNPRLFQARMDYVSLLLRENKKEEALQSLEQGVRYNYFGIPELIPFYSLTARLQREARKFDQAAVWEERVKALEKLSAASYYLRGY